MNFVGVDLNTASAPLLAYVSGIGETVAKNIVKMREELGGFNSREQLLKVSRFSGKVFEQSGGFLNHELLERSFISSEYSIDIQFIRRCIRLLNRAH